MYTIMLTKYLPSPAKSHYTFNLRDFGRVISGLMLCTSRTLGTSKEKFVRLWTHECVRVFSDRLVSGDDRNSFLGHIRATVQRRFGLTFDKLLANLDINGDGHIDTDVEARGLIFADFVSKDRSYDEVDMRAVIGGVVAALEGRSEATDAAMSGAAPADGTAPPPNVVAIVQGFLDDYNAMSTKPMRLVLFMFAIEHISRICRVLRIAGGHALLVGIGGSGRQSLTLLAAFITGADVIAVKTTKLYGAGDWRDDLKRVMTRAGGEGKSTVFLLTDTQVTMSLQMEDIHNLLNSGDIPNLFAVDEKSAIQEQVTRAARSEKRAVDTVEAAYAFFVDRVRENLHVVLALSPASATFRDWLRQYPSLVNCCTIDWFSAWPRDALRGVAMTFLADIDVAEQVRLSAIDACVHFHVSVAAAAEQFQAEMRRAVHVTPTSFLELINSFQGLLSQKRDAVSDILTRYEVGLEKLDSTEANINGMKQQLTDLQPVLVQSGKDTEEMMKVVDLETIDAEKIRAVVSAEETVAAGKAAEARGIKEECEADLAEVLPIMESALAALDTLKKADITELKSIKVPVDAILLVMEAVRRVHAHGGRVVRSVV